MQTMTITTSPRAPAARWPRRAALLLAVLAVLALLLPAAPAAATDTATVDVHFTPEGGECDVAVPYERQVALPRVLTGALEELLEGPTAQERAAGATSMFGPDTAGMLRSVNIRDGVAHIDFADLREVIPNASTSCGSASLLAQLDATATQFPTVQRARYAIGGSEQAFYAWLQRDVPPTSAVTATRGSLTNRHMISHLDGDAATLRAVRVGRHDGFDRVVFEFDGGQPGYAVHYRPVASTDGGSAPIPTRGTVALQVYLQAASVDLDADGFPLTFTPQEPIRAHHPTLREVRFGGFFEGGTTFGVGLAGRSGFRVLELTGPPRLAIDVAHGAQVRTLERGDRGADVRDWQDRLNIVQFGPFAVSPGHSQGGLDLDGVFGPATARATRTFQDAEGVTVTGRVDAATRAAMLQALRRAADVSP